MVTEEVMSGSRMLDIFGKFQRDLLGWVRKREESEMISRFGAQATTGVEVPLTEVRKTVGWVVNWSLTLVMWGLRCP